MYGYRFVFDTAGYAEMVQDDVDFSWYARDEVESTMSDYDYELRAKDEEIAALTRENAELYKILNITLDAEDTLERVSRITGSKI